METGILVVDLDGTLAQCKDRAHFLEQRPKNYDAYHEAGCRADPFPNVVELVNLIQKAGYYIIIVTGRTEKFRYGTVRWLNYHIPGWNRLIMRGNQDRRPIVTIKREVFLHLNPRQVLAILEDRDDIVRMGRELGFTVIQVNEGAF